MAGQKLSAPAPTTLAKRIPPVTCSIIVPTKATTNTALAKSLRAPKTKLSRRFRVSGDTKTPSATRWSQKDSQDRCYDSAECDRAGYPYEPIKRYGPRNNVECCERCR